MAWFRDEDSTVISDTRFREICNDCRERYAKNNTSAPCHGDELSCHRYDFADTSEFEKEIRAKVIEEFAEKLIGDFADWQMSEDDVQIKYIITQACEGVEEIAEQLKGE